MPKDKLFEGEESENEDVSFKLDNQYAKRYDNWREKEELHKLEQKYGDKPLTSDATSSDSEDESDEPPEVSEEVETQFLKTLSLLKTKDPRIYDPNYKFFDEAIQDKEKLEEKEEEKSKPKKEVNSLAAAFAESDEDDDDDKEIFKVEEKAPEPAKKEVKLREYLSGVAQNLGTDPAVERELAPLRELWSDPRINEGEAFLRDYILQKKYLDHDEPGVGDQLRDDEGLEADERTVEQQGLFERAYNFRYEEPDQEFLKRYPRTLNSIRPKDDRRARKRAEIRTRKEEEKRRKMEEIARLKAFKLKEIQEKIAKIKEVTGNDELAFKDEDLEGDFDPEEHDRRMRAIFDQHYYEGQDERKPEFPDLDEELEIENWDKFELERGGDDELNPQGDEAPHCEDEDFNMDADYDPKKARTTLLEEIQETLGKKRRNRKKKSKLAKLLEADKPKYVPTVTDRSFNQYMEEYYKIDCEDVIGGDLPTRFKYREVVPNSFGLSVEEILLADDKELNQWASLKKAVRIRPENVERSELNTYKLKAQDQQLKRKMLPSLFKDIPEEPEIVVPMETVAKKKKKNKHNKEQLQQNNDLIITNDNEPYVPDYNDQHTSEQTSQNDSPEVEVTKKHKKKSKHKISEDTVNENDSENLSFKDDITKANALENGAVETKKRKNKNKLGHNGNVTVENSSKENSNMGDISLTSTVETTKVESKRQKKNRKRKHSEANATENDSKNVNNKNDSSIAETTQGTTVGTNKSKKKRKAKKNNDILQENRPNTVSNKEVTAVTVHTGAQQGKKKKRKQKRAENLNKLKQMEIQNEMNTETSQDQIKHESVLSKTILPKDNNDQNPNNQTKLTKKQEKINKHKALIKSLLQKQSIIKTKGSEGPSKSGGFTVPNPNKKKRKKPNNDSLPKRPFMRKKLKGKGKGAAGSPNVEENPLGQLSDERLKAYGLNPKKYRGFLKYKKF